MWFRSVRNHLRKNAAQKRGLDVRPTVERLEDRMTPTPLTVTTSSDLVQHTGTSLRDAIVKADSDARTGISDSIGFAANLSGGDTITLSQGALVLGATGGSGTGIITINGGGVITINGNGASSVLQIDAGQQASLSGLIIKGGNAGTKAGGGIVNSGTLTVNGATITGNVGATGGGIANLAGAMTVSNSIVAGNTASDAGGGIANQAILTLSNDTITDNTADEESGGIGNSGTLTVLQSTISGNVVKGTTSTHVSGGVGNSGTATISQSTISGNSADVSGGVGNSGAMTVTDSTITGNSATSDSGGVGNSGTLTVVNATIAGNSAGKEGGGLDNSHGLTLLNTIIANNNAPSAGDVEADNGAIAGGHDLIGTASGLAGSGISQGDGRGDIVGAPPQLAALGNYGGPTSTYALQTGSPALGAAGAVTTIAQAATKSATTLTVAAAAAIASTAGQYDIVVDGEEMLVTGVDLANDTLTVTRDINGISAAPQKGDPVYLFVDQTGKIRGTPPDIGASEVTAPAVTSVSPAVGATGGGTRVTITGTDLANASAVDFGGTTSTRFVSDTPDQIVIMSPGHAAGLVNVKVVTAVGTSAASAADTFTYMAAPTVSRVTPLIGPQAGGTALTITGANLSGATAVDFGSKVVTHFVSDTASKIVVDAPAGSGVVTVKVVTPFGSASAGKFTYLAAPTVSKVSPDQGVLASGTLVTITGTNFSKASAVDFGSAVITRFVSRSDTKIVLHAPAGSAGNVNVRVVSPGGTSAVASADVFTYEAAPTLASIGPASGSLAGGTEVTITGTNLANATVHFGSKLATIVSDSATEIVVLTPPGAAGAVKVKVTTLGGVSAEKTFTYIAAPTVSSITPKRPWALAKQVTITGENLAGAAVYMYSPAAGVWTPATITHNTATQIVFNSPYPLDQSPTMGVIFTPEGVVSFSL